MELNFGLWPVGHAVLSRIVGCPVDRGSDCQLPVAIFFLRLCVRLSPFHGQSSLYAAWSLAKQEENGLTQSRKAAKPQKKARKKEAEDEGK